MASPLRTSKPTVNLAESRGAPGSRIRRDPPPKAQTVVRDQAELDRWAAAFGVAAFALAIGVIIFAIGSVAGWSPAQYTISIRLD